MDRRNVIPITLIVASIILAVVSYVILPQNVMIQFSVGSSGNTYVPKIVAILLALLLGVGGAIAEIIMKEDVRAKRKCLVVSIVGVFVFILAQSQILWDNGFRTYLFLLTSNSLRKKYSSSRYP